MDEVLQAIKRAHGGSMTGQLAAVNVSGAFSPIRHGPAAGRALERARLRPAQTAAGTSGSHTPMGCIQALQVEATGESGAAYAGCRRRRSKASIGIGVLVAAVLGGLLGMAAFRMTSAGVGTRRAGADAPATTTLPTAPSHRVERAPERERHPGRHADRDPVPSRPIRRARASARIRPSSARRRPARSPSRATRRIPRRCTSSSSRTLASVPIRGA